MWFTPFCIRIWHGNSSKSGTLCVTQIYTLLSALRWNFLDRFDFLKSSRGFLLPIRKLDLQFGPKWSCSYQFDSQCIKNLCKSVTRIYTFFSALRSSFFDRIDFLETSRDFLLPIRIRDLDIDSEVSYCYRLDSQCPIPPDCAINERRNEWLVRGLRELPGGCIVAKLIKQHNGSSEKLSL